MPQRATVAIVGRPNVGKSTLFNRILRRRAAVVHGQPGSTRDRHYGATSWNGRPFYVVDTGGLLLDAREGIEALVRESALVALEEADLLLLVVDVQTGVTDLDLQIARLLQRRHTPVLLVANKTEAAAGASLAAEFWKLGLGEPLAISAVHGTGSGELLDRIVQLLPSESRAAPESDAELRVAIVGRPNVGKSSLVNALLGEARALVSPEPGTTRDAIDSRLRWHGHDIDLIDTAGLRRRSRTTEAVDVFASIRALRSIERADVCLVLVDASEGITQQDTRIAGYVHRAGRGLVVCFNKWDLVERDTHTADAWRREFETHFAFARYAPVLFISVSTGQRLHRCLESAWQVGTARTLQVPTAQVNRVLEEAAGRRQPHFHGGGNGHVKYGLQVGVKPPRFAVYVNNPDYFDRSYVRYLANALRAAFDFPGTRLRIELRHSPARNASATAGAS